MADALSTVSGLAGGIGGVAGGLAQLGTGIWGAIKGAKDRKKYAQLSEQALNAMPEYETSQYAKDELAQAQAQANAINPATAMLYRQAQLGAANTAAAGQRNALSGAEAINAAIQGQSMAQNMMPSIAEQQTAYAMQNKANLAKALQGMTAEQQNVFNSRLNKNNQWLNYRLGQLGGANQMLGQGLSNISGGLGATASGASLLSGMNK